LNGTIAAAYIQGVQQHGVAATIKHYVGNDAEFERMSMDSQIGERALREIYLKPFQVRPLLEPSLGALFVLTTDAHTSPPLFDPRSRSRTASLGP
jgi:hypothetical protein